MLINIVDHEVRKQWKKRPADLLFWKHDILQLIVMSRKLPIHSLLEDMTCPQEAAFHEHRTQVSRSTRLSSLLACAVS